MNIKGWLCSVNQVDSVVWRESIEHFVRRSSLRRRQHEADPAAVHSAAHEPHLNAG